MRLYGIEYVIVHLCHRKVLSRASGVTNPRLPCSASVAVNGVNSNTFSAFTEAERRSHTLLFAVGVLTGICADAHTEV